MYQWGTHHIFTLLNLLIRFFTDNVLSNCGDFTQEMDQIGWDVCKYIKYVNKQTYGKLFIKGRSPLYLYNVDV